MLDRSERRAQANLLALVAALVALTTVSTVAVVVADGALADATREPVERQRANAVADRVLAADGALAERENALNATRLGSLDAAALRDLDAVPEDADVRVRVDGETVASTGDVAGGTTVSRIALVVDREARTVTPGLDGRDRVTLPRRTPWIAIDLTPAAGEVTTVRANDRVVLHDPDGLASGRYRVDVSRRVTPVLAFAGDDLDTGAVEVTYAPADSRKVVVEVTVDVE
ncbi:hypothetical protein G9C85_11370 [Halorubellus sp. JP-L1]|uniref:DUF7263 family protein n=1 Tax=Halorubellus sp. JP-L1 TaxID=2715753 RepID=UPI00140C7BAB|nr:hypothetical protein [Halorubellus sp. JP-L1]NHN42220.1 hypothetical protein [Halorubellus sp. JP-L1]